MNVPLPRFSMLAVLVLAMTIGCSSTSAKETPPGDPSVVAPTKIEQLTEAYLAYSVSDHSDEARTQLVHDALAVLQIDALASVENVHPSPVALAMAAAVVDKHPELSPQLGTIARVITVALRFGVSPDPLGLAPNDPARRLSTALAAGRCSPVQGPWRDRGGA